MLFFVWYDDSPQKPVVDKIQAAIAAYVVRFQTRPSLVLVNAVDHMEMTEVTVRSSAPSSATPSGSGAMTMRIYQAA